MKRILTITLAILTVLTMAACGKKDQKSARINIVGTWECEESFSTFTFEEGNEREDGTIAGNAHKYSSNSGYACLYTINTDGSITVKSLLGIAFGASPVAEFTPTIVDGELALEDEDGNLYFRVEDAE